MRHSSLGSGYSKRRWCPLVSVRAHGYSRERHRDVLLTKGFALMLSSAFTGNTSRKVRMARAQEANKPFRQLSSIPASPKPGYLTTNRHQMPSESSGSPPPLTRAGPGSELQLKSVC